MSDEVSTLTSEVAASKAATVEAATELKALRATVADLAAQIKAQAADPAAVTALAQQLHDATATLVAAEDPSVDPPAAPAAPTTPAA